MTKSQGIIGAFGSTASTTMLGVGAAIGAVGAISIKAASDLGESMNKAKVVFGDAQESVIAFSETSAKSFGISQAAALESAASFGAMAQSAGLTEQASAGLSIKLVKLAADMASFNNEDPSEMLERLRSGLAGEAEPLRRFGIFISEARVQQEAWASGIARTGQELTDAQKIQARYNIILEDTTKQQGDFARTIGTSMPNKIRQLTAEFTDLAAELGEHLLPVAIKLLEVLQDIVDIVELAGGPVGDTKNSMQELGGTLGTLNEESGENVKRLIDTSQGFQQVKVAVDATGGAYKTYTRVVTDADGVQHTFIDTMARTETGGYRLVTSVEQLSSSLDAAKQHTRAFANLSDKAFNEFKQSVAESTRVAIGDFEHLNDAFSVTPQEMRRQLHIALQVARTFQQDLRTIIRDPKLTDDQKQALANLPPEYRHAFVKAKGAAREEIVNMAGDLANVNARTFNQITSKGKTQATSGGHAVGLSMMTGTIKGIVEGSPAVSAAAAKAVSDAIASARRAADAYSPSRAMEKLGEDMTEGLVQGMLKDQQKVVDATKKLLSKILDAAREFKSTIKGGFAGLLDITGAFTQQVPDPNNPGGFLTAPADAASIKAFFAQQVATAQEFAKTLKQLERAGASKALLAQIASAGPEALPFAKELLNTPSLIGDVNAALGTITQLAGDTADRLGNRYFGERIDEVRDILHRQLDQLHRIADRLEGGGGGGTNITVNGSLIHEQEAGDYIAEKLLEQSRRGGSHHR